jgi:hypothetical protein
MPHLRGSVLLLLVSAVLASRALSDAGSGSVVSEAGSGSVVSEAGSGSVVSEASPPTSPPPTSPSSSGAVVASTPSYQTALDQLYAQVDLDPKDGSLSQAEYDAMVVKLGIGSESPFNDASFFSTLDANSSGGLSQAEIISYFSAHTGEVQKAIDALAGVPSGDDAFSFKVLTLTLTLTQIQTLTLTLSLTLTLTLTHTSNCSRAPRSRTRAPPSSTA